MIDKFEVGKVYFAELSKDFIVFRVDAVLDEITIHYTCLKCSVPINVVKPGPISFDNDDLENIYIYTDLIGALL
jgi:hypothetical protein